MLFPKSVIFRPHSLDLTGCRVLYETVTTGVAGCFLVTRAAFSDV